MKKLIVSILFLYIISTSPSYTKTSQPLMKNPKEEAHYLTNKKTKNGNILISHAVINQLKKKNDEKNNKKKLNINKKNVINHKEQAINFGEVVISEETILTNIKKKTFLRIGKGLYKINNKKWSNKKIEIKNNDTLIIKHTSSLFRKSETTTNLYINDILKFTFTSTTL